jgi:hypothetical protein
MFSQTNSPNGHLSRSQDRSESKLFHSTNTPRNRFNNSSIHFALKSSINNSISLSHRSTKSSIYSQTSKLQSSSVFQKIYQSPQLDSTFKRLQQKDA